MQALHRHNRRAVVAAGNRASKLEEELLLQRIGYSPGRLDRDRA